MSDKILTPLTVWEDFTLNNELKEEVISRHSVRNIVYKEVYLNGRKTKEGMVKIYALISYDKRLEKMPGILILPNFSHEINGALVKEYAKKGYYAMIIDLRGCTTVDSDDGAPIGEEEREHIKQDRITFESASEEVFDNKPQYADEDINRYTIYPNDIKYANYETVKHDLQSVKADVKSTCWYEWGCVAKYAYNYMRSIKSITSIGALGTRRGASVLWQLAATEPTLKCSAFTFNAGWRAYRNYYKVAVNSEPNFSSENYKYLAGIEPQSYAMYVKCPTLLISPTNSIYFDADRATDTIARIDQNIYSGFDFSLGSSDVLGCNGWDDILLFFEKYLKGQDVFVPEQPDILCNLVDDGVEIEVKADKTNLVKLEVFASEDTVNPAYRSWNSFTKLIKKEGDKYTYKYEPHASSKIAFFFAKATYKNGFTSSSRITAKSFENVGVNDDKVNIIYSSTFGNEKNAIYPARIKACFNGEYMMTDNDAELKFKKGPMDIMGVTAKYGLITFKCNATCDKLKEDAILKLDIFTKTDNVLKVYLHSVSLVGETITYVATKHLKSSELWQSVSFEMSDFKSPQNLQIKSFDKVNCIMFNCLEDYVLNNIIWL